MKAQALRTTAYRTHRPHARGRAAKLLVGLALAAGTGVCLQGQSLPAISYEKTLLLSWPTTAEELTVVSADSVEGPWVPWLEPIFKRRGTLCVAVPTTDAMRLFQLTPGFQFSDDFTDFNWRTRFWDTKDPAKFGLSQVNGAIRIRGDASKPSGLGFLVLPKGLLDPQCQNAAMSVDILAWDTNATIQSIGFGLRMPNEITDGQGYLAEFMTGDTTVAGRRSTLSFWKYTAGTFRKTAFDLDAQKPVRLILTAVGRELKLALYYLDKLSEPIATVAVNDADFPRGTVGLWVWSGSEYSSYDVTVDNFMVSGTRP